MMKLKMMLMIKNLYRGNLIFYGLKIVFFLKKKE